MVLQAFVDDSGSEPSSTVFVLGGFLMPAAGWIDFSNDWDKALKADRPINHYKSNEAYGLKGQFDGWSEADRDAKVDGLCEVIIQHGPERCSTRLYNRHYQESICNIPALNRFRGLESPYFLLFYEIVVIATVFHSMDGGYEPIEFFFDEQGTIGRRARDWWSEFVAGQRKHNSWFAPHIGPEPQFKNDLRFAPLQAADLYAGEMARSHENALGPRTRPLRKLSTISGSDRYLGMDELSEMRRVFLERAAAVEADKSGSLKQTVGFSTRKTKRSR